jgi:RNA polymerase sigma factor (sigma-70 family)
MPPTTAQKEQFTKLLTEHEAALRKVVLTYGVTHADREDLSQEILAQLWASFGTYDRSRPFSTWMYRVALNVAISHVRATTRRRRVITEVDTSPLDTPDPRQTPNSDEEPTTLLQRLIAALDELDRALLLLHLEQRSYQEIADVLGLSASNVGTRLNRIRNRLRELAATTKEPHKESR